MKIKDITINEMGSRGYGSVKEAPTELGFGPGKRAPVTAADYAELQKQRSAAPNLSYMDQFRTAVGIPVGGTVAGGAPTATAAAPAAPKGAAAQKTPVTNPKKVLAKSDPAVKARQQELIAAGAKNLKADGVMGDKTRAAEKQFGSAIDAAKPTNNASSSMTGDTAQATDRFAGQAKTDAQTGQNNLGVAGANSAANPGTAAAPSAFNQGNMGTRADPAADPTQPINPMAGDQRPAPSADPAADPTQPINPMAGRAPSAELDRIKQLAIGNQPAGVVPAPIGQAAQQEPTAQVAPVRGNPMQPNIIEPQNAAMPLPANIGSMKPDDAARELRAAQAAAGKPVLEPSAQVVGTGTGGSMKTGTGGLLTTGSLDQIEWQNRPENRYGNKPYPGAAAVAQQDAERKASGDKNLSKVKNFFGFGDKSKAAQPAAAQPAAAQPAAAQTKAEPINKNIGGGGYSQMTMRESDDALLATIRNIR